MQKTLNQNINLIFIETSNLFVEKTWSKSVIISVPVGK